jgi:hypothetical protein
MSVKLNCPFKPEKSLKTSNSNGKTIPYPGFELRHWVLQYPVVITIKPLDRTYGDRISNMTMNRAYYARTLRFLQNPSLKEKNKLG